MSFLDFLRWSGRGRKPGWLNFERQILLSLLRVSCILNLFRLNVSSPRFLFFQNTLATKKQPKHFFVIKHFLFCSRYQDIKIPTAPYRELRARLGLLSGRDLNTSFAFNNYGICLPHSCSTSKIKVINVLNMLVKKQHLIAFCLWIATVIFYLVMLRVCVKILIFCSNFVFVTKQCISPPYSWSKFGGFVFIRETIRNYSFKTKGKKKKKKTFCYKRRTR